MRPDLFDFNPKFTIAVGNTRVMYGKNQPHPEFGATLMTITICQRGTYLTSIAGVPKSATLLASMYCEAYVRELPTFAQLLTEDDIITMESLTKKYLEIKEPFPVLCSYHDLVSSKAPSKNADESDKDVC